MVSVENPQLGPYLLCIAALAVGQAPPPWHFRQGDFPHF